MSDYIDYGYLDEVPCHAWDYLLAPLLAMLDKEENTCILDLGCGNGFLVNALIAKGYNAYGTDASQQGIEIAAKINPGRFYLQDISSGKLPVELQDMVFDTVISTEVIEHLYNPQAFIQLCYEILPPAGGQLIISTPYHGYLKNLLLSIFNKWDGHLDPLWMGGHIKFWSKATLSSIINRNGFSVTSFRGCGRFPFFWKSMMIKAKKNK